MERSLHVTPNRGEWLMQSAIVVGALTASPNAMAQSPVGSPFSWGYPVGAQVVPVDIGTFSQIACAWYHAVGLRRDGSVVTWGNQVSELLDVPAGLTDCVKVSTRDDHSLALTAEGEIVAWGYNDEGQCDVPQALDIAIDIAAGSQFSLGIDSHGKVYGWGNNQAGQASPPANLGPCYKVAAGQFHAAALRVNGKVVCWGSNISGECDVPANLGSCKKVDVGVAHTVALRTDGTVVCWGTSELGVCTPPPGLGPCLDISAGAYHTLALKADGTIVGWGANNHGQSSSITTGGPYFSVSTSPFYYSYALRDLGPPTKDRLNNDKRADLVLHNKALKQAAVWFMNGLVTAGGGPTSIAPASAQWTAQGLGDFNGDGYADILWRTETGNLRIWLMKDQQVLKSSDIINASPLPKKSSVIAIGDVNGDRMSDIVVRSSATGSVSAWLMTAATRTEVGALGSVNGLSFVGSGDFDGDGNTDLAFRNTSGVVQIWLVDGFSKVAAPVSKAGPVSAMWQAQAIGDLDGDGKDDIVWRRTEDGQINGWLMNGAVKKAGGGMGTVGIEWTLATCADLNGNGKEDLVWSNTTEGEINGWLMDGLVKLEGGLIGAPGTGWTIVNR